MGLVVSATLVESKTLFELATLVGLEISVCLAQGQA